LMSSMSIVIIGGLTYATFMTLYIVPMMYDLFFKRMPHVVDIGSEEDLDDVRDDAAEFLAQQAGHKPTEARTVSPSAPAPLMGGGGCLYICEIHQRTLETLYSRHKIFPCKEAEIVI